MNLNNVFGVVFFGCNKLYFILLYSFVGPCFSLLFIVVFTFAPHIYLSYIFFWHGYGNMFGMTNNIINLSTRKYIIAFIEGDSAHSFTQTIKDILDDSHEWEWCYACHERLDDILDLKVNDRLSMEFNRDNDDSVGYIKRIA